MIGLGSLRWLLTAAFGAASLFHLGRCLRPRSSFAHPAGEHRFSEVLHLLMGAAMVVMIWPWGRVVPTGVWAVVFACSAAWFVARAVWSAGRRLMLGFFATAMGAMVWMGLMMPAQASTHEVPGMPGMAMSAPGRYGWISGVLGTYLVVAAIWWVLRGLRLGGLPSDDTAAAACSHPPIWIALCHGLMSAAMGLALLAMV
jgi:hypothetical protein